MLDEFAGEGVGVLRHVNAASESIGLVVKHNLLNLELARAEGSGDDRRRATRRARCDTEDVAERSELNRHLHLLGQEIRRQGVSLANTRGDVVGERQNDVRHLGNARQIVGCRRVTTEGQNRICGVLVGLLAESVLEDLVARSWALFLSDRD